MATILLETFSLTESTLYFQQTISKLPEFYVPFLLTKINKMRILLNLQLQACTSLYTDIRMWLLLTDSWPKSIHGLLELPYNLGHGRVTKS